MITVNVNAPSLRPKSKPEDMEKIKALYAYLDERLSGLEEKMQELPCEKLVITVDTATHTQRDDAIPRRLSCDEVTLDEVCCNMCDTKMNWVDEENSWVCPTCGNAAWQDETCGPDELFFENSDD